MSLEPPRHSPAEPKILGALRRRTRLHIAATDLTEREQLEKEILQVAQHEQERIGQDLHDGLCQFLSGIKFKATLLEQKLQGKAAGEARDAAAIERLLNDAIQQARNIARGLHPVGLEARGLRWALQALAASIADVFKVTCTCRFRQPVLVQDQSVAMHLYRIAQEAIHNALRHGHASNIVVRLSCNRHHFTLSIQNDGARLPARCKNGSGIGLPLMQYRARAIRGTLVVGPAPDGGTIVTCLVPRSTLNRQPPP
jgi:signal transduction histidine kinase